MPKWHKVNVSKERLRKVCLLPESVATPERETCVYVHPRVYTMCGASPRAYLLLLPTWKTFFCCFGDSGCLGSVSCQKKKMGRRFTRMKCRSPVTDSLGTQGALSSPTLLCLTETSAAVVLAYLTSAQGPPPVGKNPQSWVSSHSNLSFRTLSAPHNGPGDHSRQPPPLPSLYTAGKWALPSTTGGGVGSSSGGTSPSGKL